MLLKTGSWWSQLATYNLGKLEETWEFGRFHQRFTNTKQKTKQAQAYTCGKNSSSSSNSSTQILVILISQTPDVVLYPVRWTWSEQGHLLGSYAEVSTCFISELKLKIVTHPEFLFKLFLNPFCDVSKFDLTITELWSCWHKQQWSSSKTIPAQQRYTIAFFIKDDNQNISV